MVSPKIIVDTREQYPLIKSRFVLKKKLDEGDYCLEGLQDKVVIERKSPQDLYGSIIQGHIRFVDEIIRARLQGKVFYVVVECTEKAFFGKQFYGSQYCKLGGNVLAKVISTLIDRYGIIFVWCENHRDAWLHVCAILEVNYLLFINRELVVDRKSGKILSF